MHELQLEQLNNKPINSIKKLDLKLTKKVLGGNIRKFSSFDIQKIDFGYDKELQNITRDRTLIEITKDTAGVNITQRIGMISG